LFSPGLSPRVWCVWATSTGRRAGTLLAYRQTFRIGRPYWAGPRNALHHHLHLHDAVGALAKAAQAGHAGQVFYATDGTPLAFSPFMDDFARRVGNPLPSHVPRIATGLIKLVLRKEHMQPVALAMPAQKPLPRVPGWKPRYADHHDGLDLAHGGCCGRFNACQSDRPCRASK
jgi:nucleoside-diphosphate-sugar epimerase